MSRLRKNDYKYTTNEVRQTVWHDCNHSNNPLECYKAVITVNVQYESPEEVYEDVREDLEPWFGDVSHRKHIQANREAFRRNAESNCFQAFYNLRNGKWVIELMLRKFWNGKFY